MKRTEVDSLAKVKRVIYSSGTAIREEFERDHYKQQLSYMVAQAPSHWIQGGFSGERALQCCEIGLLDNVELIRAEREKAERLDVQVQFPAWQPDMAGAMPDVAAFVAGDPLSMRRMVNTPSDVRPIKIFVGTASSCTFSSDQLAKRGALVSALALQLAKTRSVQIYAVNAGNDYTNGLAWVVMVCLPLPAALADLSWWLCHSASARGILYAVERAETGTLSWPYCLSGCENYFTPEALKIQAQLFGAGPSDLVIPFPFGTDPALIDPEKWMRQSLERVNAA